MVGRAPDKVLAAEQLGRGREDALILDQVPREERRLLDELLGVAAARPAQPAYGAEVPLLWVATPFSSAAG